MLLAAAAVASSLATGALSLGPVGLAPIDNDTLVKNPGVKPKNLGFGAQFNLGYLATHSASTNTSLNFELKLGYNTPSWQNRVDLQAISSSTDGQTTAEQYFGAAQSNHLLTTRSYVFGYLGYIHDRFSGYRYQASEVVGYGVRVLSTKSQLFKLEVGLGATQAQQTTGNGERSPVGRLRETYSWQFSDNGSLAQSMTLEKSNYNLYSKLQTSVQAQLVGNLAFVVSYSLQHNSQVPIGSPRTTSSLSVSVQYTFGSIFGQS